MLRKILGVFFGIVAAVFISMGAEYLQKALYPPPAGLDPADPHAVSAYTVSLPVNALLILLTGWFVGSFVCGLLIRLIAKSKDITAPFLAGLFLLCAGIVDMFSVLYPTWFIITGMLIFIPITLLGHAIIRGR